MAWKYHKTKVSLTQEGLESYYEHHTKQLEIITYFLWGTARTKVIRMEAIQRYVVSVNDELLGDATYSTVEIPSSNEDCACLCGGVFWKSRTS